LNLKKQITGDTFNNIKLKAFETIEELIKDATEIDVFKKRLMGEDTIDIMDFIKNNNA
jgi:hypothetical protein